MKNPFKAKTAEAFFWSNAGYSWMTATETPAKGRKRCAQALARAEREASEAGYSFIWEQDTVTDAEFRETKAPYYLWRCACRDIAGRVIGSLGGVDFGPWPGEPWGNLYRRVCEAEIAMEALWEDKYVLRSV